MVYLVFWDFIVGIGDGVIDIQDGIFSIWYFVYLIFRIVYLVFGNLIFGILDGEINIQDGLIGVWESDLVFRMVFLVIWDTASEKRHKNPRKSKKCPPPKKIVEAKCDSASGLLCWRHTAALGRHLEVSG